MSKKGSVALKDNPKAYFGGPPAKSANFDFLLYGLRSNAYRAGGPPSKGGCPLASPFDFLSNPSKLPSRDSTLRHGSKQELRHQVCREAQLFFFPELISFRRFTARLPLLKSSPSPEVPEGELRSSTLGCPLVCKHPLA